MTPSKDNLRYAVNQAFTPSAPVDDVRLFAHRPEAMMACIQAFLQKGRHIALYGERGVGKTSLANVVPDIIVAANMPSMHAIRVDCNTMDSYNSIWRKIFRELRLDIPVCLENGSSTPADPEELRFLLNDALQAKTLIVVDEFDRVADDEALSLLADTVKALSDHASSVTLMFVGVASSVTNLLGEHESVIRNVEQIPMPRMSYAELAATLDRGFDVIKYLTLSEGAKDQIIATAEGLPYFAHTLGLNSALAAVNDDRREVLPTDVAQAEGVVMKTHSMVTEYRAATLSHQPGNLFQEVLLACAYAPRDSIGYFRPSGLREPLTEIVGREMDIPNFQRHLNELSSDKRHALFKDGEPRHYVYRFRNPLLQPYVKMVGRSSGRISPARSQHLADKQAAKTAPSLLDPI